VRQTKALKYYGWFNVTKIITTALILWNT